MMGLNFIRFHLKQDFKNTLMLINFDFVRKLIKIKMLNLYDI